VEVATFGKILGPFSPIVPPSAAGIRSLGAVGGNVLITGPPSWRLDVTLATAICKNLPAENTHKGCSAD